MALTPPPDNSRRTHLPKSDFNIDFTFDPQPSSARHNQLPPPRILGVHEQDYSLQSAPLTTHLLWQRPSDYSTLSTTKPLSITPKSPPKEKHAHGPTPPKPTASTGFSPTASGAAHPTTAHSVLHHRSMSQTTSPAETHTNHRQPQQPHSQTVPANPPVSTGAEAAAEKKTQPQPPSTDRAEQRGLPTTSAEKTSLDLEKIGAIPVPHRVNRQFNEQKKLRGTLSFMAWAFSLAILAILALACVGGWELWQRITSAEKMAGSINNELRTQLRDTSYRLAELENSLKETRATATTLSDLRREEAAERHLLRESIATLTIRLDELENNAKSRLRSVALSEQDVQNLRKELSQIRDTITTQQNRFASEIATLQRRLEAVENFLARATQRAEQQQRR